MTNSSDFNSFVVRHRLDRSLANLDILKADGIVGLGMVKKDSIVNKLYSEGKIEKNLFTFQLGSED